MKHEIYNFTNKEIHPNHSFKYYIVRTGSSRVSSDFNIERSSAYPYCVIHYVVEGYGFVIHRGKKHSFSPGKIFILGPGEAHRYTSTDNTIMSFKWIEFSGGDSERFTKAIIESLSPVVNEETGQYICKYITRIQNLTKGNNDKSLYLISKLIYSLLLYLYRLGMEKSQKYLNIGDIDGISRVKEYINNNISENLTIERLAAVANFSPAYFAKLFHVITGNTPAKYIQEHRLNLAKELLALSEEKVDSISDKLGFCNTSHFIRVFKKAEGMTPANYRHEAALFFKNPH